MGNGIEIYIIIISQRLIHRIRVKKFILRLSFWRSSLTQESRLGLEGIMDYWNQNNIGVKPFVTITVEPVSSDDNSDVDSIFFELSETEASDRTLGDLDDCSMVVRCKTADSEAPDGEITFECETDSNGPSFLSPHKSNLTRANSSPISDTAFSEIDSEGFSSLKIEPEQPRRRNTISDIFRWYVVCH